MGTVALMSDSDSDSDGACWGEVSDLLDVCATTEATPDGELFRHAVAASQIEHVSEADHQRLAEMLHEAGVGWLAATLAEYELDNVNKLHSLFAGPAAADTLMQLGCSDS